MKKIFENGLVVVYDTEKDYDFKYVIENKNNYELNLYFTGLDDYLELDKSSWVGLFNGDYSKSIVDSLINEDYTWNYIYE